jgi:hypothetical protein
MHHRRKYWKNILSVLFVLFLLVHGAIWVHHHAYAVATPAPAGYWPFSEGSGTTASDFSGNGNTGTISGATWIAGQSGEALNFNGTSNYVDMGTPSPAALQFGTGSFTVMAWFKIPTTAGANTRVVSTGNNGSSSGYYIGLGSSGCGASTCVSGGLGSSPATDALFVSTSTTTYNDNNWHQEAMVIDRTAGTAQLYVDGVAQTLKLSASSCGSGAGTTSITLSGGTACANLNASGAEHFSIGSNNISSQYFTGGIDKVRVYGSALTSTQIGNIYNNDLTPAPVGYWPFDDGSGTTAEELSGNNYTGTINGATWTTAGKVNDALSFNGTSNYVSTTNSVVNTSLSFSVGAWVKLTALAANETFVSGGGTATAGFFLQYDHTQNQFSFRRPTSDAGGTNYYAYGTGSAPTTATWYYLVGVQDATAKTLSLYINGVMQGTATSDPSMYQATGNLEMGRGLYGSAQVDYVNGIIDEVRIYSSALSAAEVTNLYNNDVAAVAPATSNATFSGTVGSTATYTLPTTLTDELNPAPGWSLSITSTTLTSGANTLPTTASTITSVSSSPTLTNSITLPLTVPAATSAPTALDFFNTAAGTGTGAFTITPTISVIIPATAKTGTYTSTVTLTQESGP